METKKLTKEEFLEKLKTDKEFYKKYGRKNITEGKQVLPPCHYSWQVYTRELSQEERYNWYIKTNNKNVSRSSNQFDMDDILNTNNIPKRAISLMWNQRSVDTFLGLPFNIASYGLLLEIIAKAVNMVPDELIGNLGDTHLTDEFFKSLGEDLSLITHLDNTDFVIENYQSHPTIKAPLSN